MDVMCRVRDADCGKVVRNKIKRLPKKRVTQVLKVNSVETSLAAEDKTATTTYSVSGTKRKFEQALESHKGKKLKLDNCQGILTKLTKSKWSVPFRSPVDPNASGDYFQVINHPMDFGTIKRKLQQNKYSNSEEFKADVKLIFANATLYHPSNTWVHLYATKLNRSFDLLWMLGKPEVVKDPVIKPISRPVNNIVKATSNTKNKCPEAIPDYSPSKALHVKKLKARFADTILRAQTKIKLQAVMVDRIDVVTSHQENERLRRVQELSSQMKAECKLKKQRQHEREAARSVLEKMERSVDVTDNLGAMRYLEALVGRSHEYWNKTKSPLEQLGLYLKPEYRLGGGDYDDDDDDELFFQDIELEEGEVVD